MEVATLKPFRPVLYAFLALNSASLGVLTFARIYCMYFADGFLISSFTFTTGVPVFIWAIAMIYKIVYKIDQEILPEVLALGVLTTLYLVDAIFLTVHWSSYGWCSASYNTCSMLASVITVARGTQSYFAVYLFIVPIGVWQYRAGRYLVYNVTHNVLGLLMLGVIYLVGLAFPTHAAGDAGGCWRGYCACRLGTALVAVSWTGVVITGFLLLMMILVRADPPEEETST